MTHTYGFLRDMAEWHHLLCSGVSTDDFKGSQLKARDLAWLKDSGAWSVALSFPCSVFLSLFQIWPRMTYASEVAVDSEEGMGRAMFLSGNYCLVDSGSRETSSG